MIIDINKLRRSGKETDSFTFDYITENQLSTLPDTDVVLPIKVKGDVTILDKHSALVELEIDFTLKGECTRCLELTEKPFSISLSEQCDEDGSVYPVVNDKINLDKIVEDAVLMNMPLIFLCKEDCKGICAGCGVNLNTDKCKCKNE